MKQEEIIKSLTLEQKCALLAGGTTFGSRGFPSKGVPAFLMSDGPHGLRKQAGAADHLGIAGSEPATCFPPAGTMANSWDTALGVKNGSALEMPAPGLGSARELLAAIQSGKITERDVDARVDELLTLISRTRRAEETPSYDEVAHHALARRAAGECVVLLKNEGDFLPLARGTRVALIGDFAETPRYQGGGSAGRGRRKAEPLGQADRDLAHDLRRHPGPKLPQPGQNLGIPGGYYGTAGVPVRFPFGFGLSCTIAVGVSSADIRLETRVTVKSTDAPNPYEGRVVDCYLTADIRNVPDDQFKALLGRDVPDSKVVIGQNMTFGDLNHGRSPIFWIVWFVLNSIKRSNEKAGKADLNILFIWNMPLRSLAKMAGGMVDMEMVRGIVLEVKGWWLLGIPWFALCTLAPALRGLRFLGFFWCLIWVVICFVKNLIQNSIMENRIKG